MNTQEAMEIEYAFFLHRQRKQFRKEQYSCWIVQDMPEEHKMRDLLLVQRSIDKSFFGYFVNAEDGSAYSVLDVIMQK
jgi:hypothetical protein